jgi:hypothetical protein
MSTMVQVAEGAADAADANTVTTTAKCFDPIANKDKEIRMVLKVADKDHHTYESYEKGDDGKEVKTLTIQYTRAK